MDPGWFILFLFLLLECSIVTILVMPVPSNTVRGAVTSLIGGLWETKAIQYLSYFFIAVNLFYFYFVFDALLHPLYDFGVLTPVEMGITCEMKSNMYRNERNAYITGMSIFMFFILRRLVDIQDKLHQMRREVKRMAKNSGNDMPSTLTSGKDKKKII